MSGFASKLSAAGTRGWKDLQSLWSQSKTSLGTSDTSPGEKSSLLARPYGNEGESSRNRLLSEDGTWADWSHDSKTPSADSSPTENVPNQEWTVCRDDEELEVWLNDEPSSFSFAGKPAKKNAHWNGKYTSLSNQKQPLVDIEDGGYDGATNNARAGCDNKGWTAIGQ